MVSEKPTPAGIISPQPRESAYVLGGPREGGAQCYTEGPSKQGVRGLGAIAQQSTLSRAGQLAVPSREPVHGARGMASRWDRQGCGAAA